MNSNTLLLPCPGRYAYRMACYKERYPEITRLGLVKTISIFEIDAEGKFIRVEETRVSGIQALVPKAFMVRVWTDVTDREQLTRTFDRVAQMVQKRLPDVHLLPSHPGWVKRTLQGKTYCHLLFGAVSTTHEPNTANARLTRLIGHIDEASRYLGRRRFYVARGRHPWYNSDGYCLLHPEHIMAPWPTLKVYGTTRFGTSYITRPAPTIKCCAELNHTSWKKACRYFRIDPDAYDGIIPEISLKFDDQSDTLEVELFSVFDSIPGGHFTVSLQMLMNLPLTEEAHHWAAGKFMQRFKEIEQALEDSTGMQAAALMNREVTALKQQLSEAKNGTDELSRQQEAMTSLITRIVAGLPLETSKYLKGTLPVLLKRLRNFRIAGGSEMAVPDNNLKQGEIALSSRMWHHFARQGIRLAIGDRLLIARHPVTGTEVAEARLMYIGRTAVNPAWWQQRFSGDFDGDRISIGSLQKEPITTLVDEQAFHYPPVSKKIKTSRPITIAQANAAGMWSQAMIPTIDTYLRICNERGLDAGPMKNLLQWVVDSAKHQIDFSIEEICDQVGIRPHDRLSSLASLMAGRFGGSKHYVLMTINSLVHRAKQETGSIRWMELVRTSGALFYVLSNDGDPAYASLSRKAAQGKAGRHERFLVTEMQAVYREAGMHHLRDPRRNMEAQAVINLHTLDRKRVAVLTARAHQFEQEARLLAYRVLHNYLTFVEEIRGGVRATTRAFRHVQEAVEQVTRSTYGDQALKYLFAGLVCGIDQSITMRATTIIGYMPLVLGSYNIARIIQFLGYKRKLHVGICKEHHVS